MPLFNLNKTILTPISEKRFDLEKDIQVLTEKNLLEVFGLKFVSGRLNREFSVRTQEQDFYIDTLAFDEAQNSLVIIEYKKDKSFSVIDQGFSYLAAMLNNKAEFVLELNERLGKKFTKKDIDWEQSRIIFISNEFTNYQKNAINFKDLPMFLYEVKIYDNATIDYNPIKPFKTSESINKFIKDKNVQKISKEIKVYTVDDHFKPDWIKSKELFEELREKILELDERLEEKYNKFYIGYKFGFYNLCAIHVFKSKLRIDLVRVDKSDMDDPKKKVIKNSWKEFGWGKQCSYNINDRKDIEYAVFLIKQVYEKFYK